MNNLSVSEKVKLIRTRGNPDVPDSVASISINIPRFCTYTMDDLRHWFNTEATQDTVNLILIGLMNSDKATIFSIAKNAGVTVNHEDNEYVKQVSKVI